MITKVCKDCGVPKSLTEFHKHSKMSDGHVNKCKDCQHKKLHINYVKNSNDESWKENEKLRQQEKYNRLNYIDRQKEAEIKFPWKSTSTYKNLPRKLALPKGIEIHHWNYNDEFLEDIFKLDSYAHKFAHKFLKLNIELRIFTDLDGNLLDTKEKHYEYLKENGVIFY